MDITHQDLVRFAGIMAGAERWSAVKWRVATLAATDSEFLTRLGFRVEMVPFDGAGFYVVEAS